SGPDQKRSPRVSYAASARAASAIPDRHTAGAAPRSTWTGTTCRPSFWRPPAVLGAYTHGYVGNVSNIPHGSAELGRAACGKPEAPDMLQHRGEPTRTCDSFEEAKIAAFELLAERAEHGQAPRGDALVRPPTGSPLTH